MQHEIKTNQQHWNQLVSHHLKSDFYELEAFKNGKNVLREIELEGLGDVKGKKLLHLQCHFGQDTLCWSRMGAECTGLDFSSEAIQAARDLNDELGMNVQFREANVLDEQKDWKEQFDIVFTSYGTIIWLPDLKQWAQNIYNYLKPNGIFYIAEFHPFLNCLDWDNNLNIIYDYFNTGANYENVEGTYAEKDAAVKGEEYFWLHSTEDVLMNLKNAGMELLEFREFPFSPYTCFPNLKEIGENRYVFKDLNVQIPYVFSLKMIKK